MTPHNTSQEELLKELQTSAAGLSSQEARQRLERYGENKLAEKRKKTNLQRFLDQFKDVMILILLLAAAVSFVVACFGHDPMEFFEPVLILLIVVLNALLGMMQESKAEKAMDALKNMSAPHARVLRDGKEQVIDAAQLVPGDIIRLEAGDFIPADARLLKSVSLKSEESALTGESVPSEKDAAAQVEEKAPLGDRSNMVFSGCSVTYGTATAVVTGTGMDTEMGKIAGLLEGEEEGQTPLQQKLAQLGKYLGFVALGACAVIFVVGLLNGIPVLEIFMTAVSLAVSAIPEGLPAIVTIVLAIGVQRMAKKNALIRRLPAVETLGGASVICSDKTGTLTQNRMTLVKLWVEGENSLETVSTENSPAGRELLRYGALCCDGSVLYKEDGTEQHIGDPTETSILVAAHKNGMEQEDLNGQYPRLAELPFDSDRKLMTSVNQMDGKIVAIVKGAFDMMAARCVAGDLEAAKEKNEEMSRDALRVLAVGYKILDEVPENPTSEELESGLTLMGLVGMIDPPRPEAKAAVATCRQAGIKPVMITGDHVVTASAIAKELGILEEGDKAITGAQLDAMSEEQLDQEVENISVYARVSPENKIRIVKAWQRKDQVVSMTGDGVNDAPALKAADIGCAMGITGTDVAKGAADMTLTDDNFATIVDAVREGRGIYANIKKVVGFLLGTNIGEVITVSAVAQDAPALHAAAVDQSGDGLPAGHLPGHGGRGKRRDGAQPQAQGRGHLRPRAGHPGGAAGVHVRHFDPHRLSAGRALRRQPGGRPDHGLYGALLNPDCPGLQHAQRALPVQDWRLHQPQAELGRAAVCGAGVPGAVHPGGHRLWHGDPPRLAVPLRPGADSGAPGGHGAGQSRGPGEKAPREEAVNRRAEPAAPCYTIVLGRSCRASGLL